MRYKVVKKRTRFEMILVSSDCLIIDVSEKSFQWCIGESIDSVIQWLEDRGYTLVPVSADCKMINKPNPNIRRIVRY